MLTLKNTHTAIHDGPQQSRRPPHDAGTLLRRITLPQHHARRLLAMAILPSNADVASRRHLWPHQHARRPVPRETPARWARLLGEWCAERGFDPAAQTSVNLFCCLWEFDLMTEAARCSSTPTCAGSPDSRSTDSGSGSRWRWMRATACIATRLWGRTYTPAPTRRAALTARRTRTSRWPPPRTCPSYTSRWATRRPGTLRGQGVEAAPCQRHVQGGAADGRRSRRAERPVVGPAGAS